MRNFLKMMSILFRVLEVGFFGDAKGRLLLAGVSSKRQLLEN